MKRNTALVAVLVILALLAVAQPARGQAPRQTSGAATPTATPSPSATNTVTTAPPSAQALVTSATAAFNAAGSGHVVVTLNATVTGKDTGKIALVLEGDAQWKTPLLASLSGNISVSAPGSPATTLPMAVVVVKKRSAVQISGQWSCSSTASVTSTTKTPVNPTSTTETTRVKSLAILGTDVVDGVPVWHVREKAVIRDTTKGKNGKTKVTKTPTTIDYFIAQADSSLHSASVSLTGTSGKDKVKETISATFSAFGEAVHATLPQACKGKTSSAAADRFEGLQRVVKLLRPLRAVNSDTGVMRVL